MRATKFTIGIGVAGVIAGGGLIGAPALAGATYVSGVEENLDGDSLDVLGYNNEALTNVAVATVIDHDFSSASDFSTSTIDWGDGTTADAVTGVVDNGDGTFTLQGTHTYVTPGTYDIVVDALDYDSGQLDAESYLDGGTAYIMSHVEEKLGMSTVNKFVPLVTGVTDVGTVFDNDGSTAGDFAATIDWGDANSSAGTVSDLGGLAFGVTGSHTYASAGKYKVVVHVTDTDGVLDSDAYLIDHLTATNKITWSLDDSGDTARSNPAGMPGTLQPGSGSPAQDTGSVAPVAGNPASMDFDGSDDVSVPDDPWLNIPQGSLDAWVNFAQKPSAAGHPMNIVSKSDQFWLHATTAAENGDLDGDVGPDAIEAKINVGGVRYVVATPANQIHTGEWYHVTATYDGDTLKLYLNGVLQGSNTAPSGPLNTSGSPFDFGTWSAAPGTDSFKGSLDEITLYRDVLTGADVQALPQPVPVAHDVADSTNEDTAKLVTLNGTQSGGATLTYKITSLPAHGTLKDGATAILSVPFTLSGNTVNYKPNANYNNADSGTSSSPDTFQYKVNDDVQQSAAGTVSMTVLAVADQTTTTYAGQSQGTTAKPGKLNVSGTIKSADPACVANRTVTFFLNKNPTVSNSTIAYNLGQATTGSASGPSSGLYSGTASLPPVSIGNWLPGNYTITAQYGGDDFTSGGVHTQCGGSQGAKALTIKKK